MSKINSIYDRLQNDVKSELQASARKYASAKRLKYTLMSTTIWQDLTVDQVKSLMTFGDVNTSEISSFGFLYGDNIIKK